LDETTGHGRLNVVQFLVELGANVNGGNVRGLPLEFAAVYGRTDIANYLIKNGADVNAIATYSDGSTAKSALIEAILSGSFDIVKILVEDGVDLNYHDKAWENKTALQVAEACQSTRITEYLRQKSGK
jgi:ankyrin repeat protein